MFRKLIICLVVPVVAAFGLGTGWARQDSPLLKKAAKKKVPLVVTADQAEFDNKAHKVIYKDNVKAVRGDATMYSDHLEVFLDQDGEEIDHIVATGEVKLVQDNRVVTAEQAVYWEAEQKIVLTGKPISREGKSVVKGKRMIYFLNHERIIIEDAESILHPEKKKGKKEGSEADR